MKLKKNIKEKSHVVTSATSHSSSKKNDFCFFLKLMLIRIFHMCVLSFLFSSELLIRVGFFSFSLTFIFCCVCMCVLFIVLLKMLKRVPYDDIPIIMNLKSKTKEKENK